MSALRIRTVDAFADGAFTGNPAGVLVLDAFPADGWMQSLAAELNLSETAFAVPHETMRGAYRLRWFTPVTEVELCGHATLAAAHCLFRDGATSPIRFVTRSGVLTVGLVGERLTMDFPAGPPVPIDVPDGLAASLGAEPVWTGRGATHDVLCELADEGAVRALVPDIAGLRAIDARGVIVTARAQRNCDYDFVSRFFAPRVGVAEDPATGSAHTVLGPYWASRLGRSTLTGFQASRRGARIDVEVVGDRVILSGRAVLIVDGVLSGPATQAIA